MVSNNVIADLPSISDIQSWVKPRVSERRFSHIAGVAKTALRLANVLECDPSAAEVAAWLHDACKETKDSDLVTQCKEFGFELLPLEETNGHILHGPVAAEVVKRELGILDENVLNAIREHTLGATDMCLLSKIIFLADALEPGRPESYREPIWQSLKLSDQDKSQIDIDQAILTTLDLNLKDLLQAKRIIHPKTIEARNHYLSLIGPSNIKAPESK